MRSLGHEARFVSLAMASENLKVVPKFGNVAKSFESSKIKATRKISYAYSSHVQEYTRYKNEWPLNFH